MVRLTEEQLNAYIAGTYQSHYVPELAREVLYLRKRVEELDKSLLLVGEKAVIDFDDSTVAVVDTAVKEPHKYKDWLIAVYHRLRASPGEPLV